MSKSITHAEVHRFIEEAVGPDTHAKRVLSLSNATLGAVHAASLSVRAIGLALSQARGLEGKHAIKQVDRLLSNSGVDVWRLFAQWVPFVVAERKAVTVTIDWTDFESDDHTTVAIQLVTRHGRATPLLWKTVPKSELAGQRNAHEDALLERLHQVLPSDVEVTVLADRGFGDVALYELLDRLSFGYVIRFRGVVHVESAGGEVHKAKEWVPPTGRPKLLRGARVTQARFGVGAVVCVHQKGMKEAWFLAASSKEATATELVKAYGRRFTCEETHRDIKDLRFGMGLSAIAIGTCERRDRLLLLSAFAMALLRLLGAAGEATGLDRKFRADTRKTREYSLFRQGIIYYGALANMREEWLRPLMEKFAELIREQAVFREAFGFI
ncbi:IS4 family transposase [Corallococcus macrosporus]|uniref:Transposase n=1 Tax=Corallococcus macrosporus DSM 14697 TaxID=1189310 RepID=A0A250JR03_9BACT|nr:IS4 family transposase [Corallococcus macrosporus]ATB45120.1 transposase [Corallococcus macrosporus DSM 14697]ATB45917.1 transposase [Corallococcus macrosporus DSM 14697]